MSNRSVRCPDGFQCFLGSFCHMRLGAQCRLCQHSNCIDARCLRARLLTATRFERAPPSNKSRTETKPIHNAFAKHSSASGIPSVLAFVAAELQGSIGSNYCPRRSFCSAWCGVGLVPSFVRTVFAMAARFAPACRIPRICEQHTTQLNFSFSPPPRIQC